MRVLIADDNRLMLEGFRRALEPVEDIEIVGATHTGSQVLPLVERRRPGARGARARDAGRGRTELPRVAARAPPGHQGGRAVRLLGLRRHPLGAHQRRARVHRQERQPVDIPAALRHAYDETVYHAIGFEPGPEDELRAAGLTERELTMLKALARGLSNKAISRELWVTEQTVKFHLGNLYRKLGVPNRLAAANIAHARGIAAA